MLSENRHAIIKTELTYVVNYYSIFNTYVCSCFFPQIIQQPLTLSVIITANTTMVTITTMHLVVVLTRLTEF